MFGRIRLQPSSQSFASSCPSSPFSSSSWQLSTQAGHLGRDIFVLPPKVWAYSCRVVWRLSKPAYGIAESGHLSQLVDEEWVSGKGILQVPGQPPLFVQRHLNGRIRLLMAKVGDDFLIAGLKSDIEQCSRTTRANFRLF